MISKFKGIDAPNIPCEVAIAIASGLFIKAEIFKADYYFNEALFIDYVDNEWCWRITSNNYKILFIPELQMSHQLGNGTRKLFSRTKVLHSTFRYYYIIRNGFYLAFYSKYLTFGERILLLKDTVKLQCTLILLYKNIKLLKLYMYAFLNAICKKMGKANIQVLDYCKQLGE